MIRLYVIGEGPTEEAFVNRVLVPHLAVRDVFATAWNLGGNPWGRWKQALIRRSRQEDSAEVRFTTLLDLYRLPKGFPGVVAHRAVADTNQRATLLERALADEIGDRRFLPYIQRHELEALVLAGLDHLEGLLDAADDLEGLARLRNEIAGMAPEDINEGPTTAPSKRLLDHVASYNKVLHGPLVLEQAGLEVLRTTCPRFASWLHRLEQLAVEDQAGAP